MKKIFISFFTVVLAALCLFGCENDEKSEKNEENGTSVSSSPFKEATSLEGGFEFPIMPND